LIANLPFTAPISSETDTFGGLDTTMWMWSDWMLSS